MKTKLIAALLALGCAAGASADVNTFVIEPNAKGAKVSPTMYGLFFEDINYAADGGLYAEKIKNRSFDFPQALLGWTTFGDVKVMNDGPFDRNPNYVRLASSGHNDKWTGLDNEGFFGVSFEKDKEYRFSTWARVPEGGEAKIRVELIDPSTMGESQNMGSKEVTVAGKDWKKYTVVITPRETVEKGKLRIFLLHPDNTVLDLEHISLFPVDTYNGHENGLRKDLAEKLADIKPGVFRFPGGCIVEGTDLESRYQWKNTVGPVENRPVNENRWHYTFPHRFFPDYYQSYGLGFFEFFQLCEEIGAEPLPILSVGLACQFQNHDPKAHVPVDSLQPYIDDALDLIEFANGPVDSEWGKLRADMGHPEPFNMKYIGIGNEQWDPIYPEHLKPFVDQIRKQHPEIKIVGSSGPDSEGKQFDYLWPEMTKLKADLVDEHFYRPEKWFLAQGNRYDNYNRKGPKVFAGEYACHGANHKKWNHFNAALLESAFMTGLERNADIVEMATYAPLFAHVEGWQWRPDMIWYDNFRSMPTASYYVQQLFSLNKGDQVVPLKMNGKPVAGNDDQNGLFASAVKDANGDLIMKATNVGDTDQEIKLNLKGLKKNQGYNSVEITTLHSDDPLADNTLDNQNVVSPVVKKMAIDQAQDWTTILPAKTFAVYRFKK